MEIIGAKVGDRLVVRLRLTKSSSQKFTSNSRYRIKKPTGPKLIKAENQKKFKRKTETASKQKMTDEPGAEEKMVSSAYNIGIPTSLSQWLYSVAISRKQG